MKHADIVVTNPPFSLFCEYVAQLIEYDKKFLIIGNQNAITYKKIFPLIKENKIWLGYGFKGGAGHFISRYEDYATATDKQDGMIRVSGVHWFTNLPHKKRNKELILYKKYSPEEYPHYDNYDAIEVSKIIDIPEDWTGVMGVPITFLDKYNPEQFEILGLSQKCGFGLNSYKKYDEYREMRQDETATGSSGKKINGNPVMRGKPLKNNYYLNPNTGDTVYSLYARIFIRNRNPKSR